jgi:hypothetical protein
MYITKKKSGIGVLQKPCRVCGEGLGDDTIDAKAIQKEYGGMSKEAPTVGMGIKLAATVALMFIPVVGWAAAIAINLPVIGDAVMGPIMKPIMGMMKKATHMESCMKWWTDSNIRGMMVGITPYPISDEIKREYQIEHTSVMPVNESGRWDTIANIFVRLLRENPSLMEAQCATMPQGIVETQTTLSPALVASYFSQLKEQARQEEYYKIVGNIGVTVQQKTTAVQETRQVASVFQLPTGVVNIDKGALVLAPGGASSNRVIEMFPMGQSVIRKK